MRHVFPLLTLIALWTIALCFHAVVSQSAPKPLELTVRPQVGFAPLDLVILVRLQPVAEDRFLRVVMDGESFSRSSEWSLEGDKAPHQFSVEWRRVYAQEADVIAAVSNASRIIRAQARQRVIVAAP